MNGGVVQVCICPTKGEPMLSVERVMAITGRGLEGDRYTTGEGSFNAGVPGKRQVTLMNAVFFLNSGFLFHQTRRNILVDGLELMWLIGRDFQIGQACFRGVKYCDPCDRPSKLVGTSQSFRKAFWDRGGLIAEVIEGGLIKVGDAVIPPGKGY